MRILFLSLILSIGFSSVARADTWPLPEKRKYCSANSRACLTVIPKKLESQLAYFEDKVGAKENAGAKSGIKTNFCRGIFKFNGKRVWDVQLNNEVSPVNALISNDGDYVITFDNWHGVGYGDNVVAIYSGKDGRLIKKLGLEGFLTQSDIYNLPASVSSIHWHGEHEIDYSKNQLILKVVKPGKAEQYFEVHVDLATGTVLDPVVDRIPSLQFLFETGQSEDPAAPGFPVDKPDPCLANDGSKTVGNDIFIGKIVSSEFPPFPPAARAVRAQGKSAFDIVVSENGTVACVSPIYGHPLLRATLVKAIRAWKFKNEGESYRGRLNIDAKSVLILTGR